VKKFKDLAVFEIQKVDPDREDVKITFLTPYRDDLKLLEEISDKMEVSSALPFYGKAYFYGKGVVKVYDELMERGADMVA